MRYQATDSLPLVLSFAFRRQRHPWKDARPAPSMFQDHLAGLTLTRYSLLSAKAVSYVSMELSDTPRCPRCPEHRSRVRYPSGLLSGYCRECNRDITRSRSGYTKAQRRCERCGTMYRGNNRAKANLCPECRTVCSTCGNPKKPSDAHSECHKCRAASTTGELCIVCRTNTRAGLKLKCWPCYDDEAPRRDRKYNLAPGQYQQMLESQHGVCALCGNPEKQANKLTGDLIPLSVDHDHTCCPGQRSCGKCVRELACRNCNVMLGMSGDDPVLLRAAADYVERHRA